MTAPRTKVERDDTPKQRGRLNVKKIRVLIHEQVQKLEEGSSRESNDVVIVTIDFTDEHTSQALQTASEGGLSSGHWDVIPESQNHQPCLSLLRFQHRHR